MVLKSTKSTRFFLGSGVIIMAVIGFIFAWNYSEVSAGQQWSSCSQYLYLANEGNGGGGTTISRIDCYGHLGIYDTSFTGPSGVATDGTYLYVSDDSPGVYRIDASGTKLALGAAFNNPNGLAVDSSGRLLVSDANAGQIRRLTLDSSGAVTNDELLADFSAFSVVHGIAEAANGDVLFSDNIGSVYRITSAMTLPVGPSTPGIALVVGTVAGGNLGHIAVDSSGFIYASNFGARIVRINPTGTSSVDVVDLGDTAVCDPSQSGSDDQPAFRGLAITPEGDLLATGFCTDNGFIFPIADINAAASSGIPISTLPHPFFKNPGGVLDTPHFDGPFGMAFWAGATISHLCGGVAATIVGTAASETLNGTGNHDVIAGLGGNDTIFAGAGNDWVCGGPGNDYLYGQLGWDNVWGGTGADRIWGGPGRDILYGNGGPDIIRGQSGNDLIRGGNGNDLLYGQTGRDRIYGGGGSDQIRGGPGLDRLFGGVGDDNLYGQLGNDRLFGGDGNDNHYGGPGADQLVCGPGTDLANGGSSISDSAAASCETQVNIP